MKKNYKLLLTVLVALVSISVKAEDFYVDGLYYTITDYYNLECEVAVNTSTKYPYTGEINIPATVTYSGTTYNVTGIGEDAFINSSITSIIIPSSIKTSKNNAFYRTENLTSVKITNLEAWCNIDFSGLFSNPLQYAHNLYLNGSLIDNLEIPTNITTIKKKTFFGGYFSSVTLHDNITRLEDECFMESKKYSSIELPSSITYIGEYAFSTCTNLKSINIPYGITEISNCTFIMCDNLTNIEIPSTVTSIGNRAFASCDALKTIDLQNIKTIGQSAFSWCTSLTEISIPNVTSIGSCAFEQCSNLRAITIPEGITTIEDKTFCGCI